MPQRYTPPSKDGLARRRINIAAWWASPAGQERKRRLGEMSKARGISLAERAMHSARMTERNPMHNPDVRAKVTATKGAEVARLRASTTMRESWSKGKITSAHRRLGSRRGINKTEAKLLEIVADLGFKYTGSGDFWVANTASGIARNPDFIWRSGKDKTAILLHGQYWHRMHKGSAETESRDYRGMGWNLFVLWVANRIRAESEASIAIAIKAWLRDIQDGNGVVHWEMEV